MMMEIGEKTREIESRGVVSFRAVRPEDEAFLLEVYGSTRAEELALTGWDPEQRDAFLKMQLDAQHVHYRGQYPSAQYLVVLLDSGPVGRLYLADKDSEIRILDVTILPEYRGAGIGTALVRDLMALSAAAGKPLTIYVETFNRSLGLFERLGFVRSGEAGYSLLLQWNPRTAAQVT